MRAMGGGWDLRERPWIPVRFLSGAAAWVGLRELFHRAHEIEDLEVPVPPAASGLLRILAAMTSRIAGAGNLRLADAALGQDVIAWRRLRNDCLTAGKFDPHAVDAYFDVDVPAGRFDLFDAERPFLQDPRLRKECVDAGGKPNSSGVNKLVFGRPTGVNGAVLFGHFTDGDPVPVPAAEAAWHLIAQLYYGPSGQCTPRRITEHRTGSQDAGPLRKTISFHVWGQDLHTSLVMGVPAPNDQFEHGPADRCPWEDDELPVPLDPLRPLTWPGRWLTGRARHAVLLEPSADCSTVTDAWVTWGTHEPPPAVADPHVVLNRPRTGGGPPYGRMADGQRALWRDLDALLLKDDGQGKRPLAFENIPYRLSPELSVRAYGFDQDGQQRDSCWFEATTPPVLAWQEGTGDLGDLMASYVGECREAAEDVGSRLDYAARLAWKLATDPPQDASAKVRLDRDRPGPWARRATGHFWPAAERTFWALLTPEQAERGGKPYEPFVRVALDALDVAMGVDRADVRAARARVSARRAIRAVVPH